MGEVAVVQRDERAAVTIALDPDKHTTSIVAKKIASQPAQSIDTQPQETAGKREIERIFATYSFLHSR